ncbi:MAG: methyltransferase domain-containing protein [Acidobacteriota bacterium]|nr:methyltransferase domain-containing protein [Acidobacteriota bacterium]
MQPTDADASAAPLSPELFWQTITAFQRSAAMKAAVELDVFTRIDEGSRTAQAIADACQAAERGIRILCDTLTVMQFLTKDEGGQYDLNELSRAFLSRKSEMFIGDAVNFIMSPMQRRGFDDLTNAVRRGGSTVREEGSLDPESPMWVTFARSMVPLMMPAAQMLAANLDVPTDRKIKVLDIAAGHGIFGILVAQQFPNAEVYAVDWANVLTVATENAQKFGVADRHHLIPGSAFDVDYGDGYDVVLLANFLHHFDQPTNEDLLRKIHQSLNDDGKVLTLEFVPNDDRVSPPSEAMFSLVMLAATPAGDAYTFAELREMFENAGFSRSRHIPLPPLPQHLIVSEK